MVNSLLDVQKKNSNQTIILKYSLSLFFFITVLYAENNILSPYVVVLGSAQDGGIPHANCQKKCCENLWGKAKTIKVSCLGIVDPKTKQSWIIDATPDFPEQLEIITKDHGTKLVGIFLTHAHVGHYTGLLHLGREIMGAKNIPVFAMPKMKLFLESNGPWSQLVSLKNIKIIEIQKQKEIKLSNHLFIKPIQVPHRDEYSETVGYQIMGPEKSLLFIPDIDKWEKWNQNILLKIKHIDFALLDGTFYSGDELPNRDMSEIPHPFIIESMELFSNLSTPNRNKIFFIHLNHSNPAINKNSAASNRIRSKRFNIARKGNVFTL